VRKEIDWFIHDKLSLIILFGLPLVILGLIGGGAFTVTNVAGTPRVFILDEDQTEYSLAYINSFRNSTQFSMEIMDNWHEPETVTAENCSAMILTDMLDAYVIIPANFTADLLNNRSASVTLIIDYDSETGSLVPTYFHNGNIIYQGEYQIFNGEIVYTPIFRPDEAFTFISITLPIIIPLLLFVCTNLVASQSIIGDEPLKRILLTPARKNEIILSKFISYSILGIILAFLSLLLLNVILKIEFYSFLRTFIIIALVPIFGVSYGILFSTISTTKIQAAQLSLFSFILQFVFLIFIRIEPIVSLIPVEVIRETFTLVAFRGITFSELWLPMGQAILQNMIVLSISMLLYKWKK
jgi:hypothetical protein